MNDLTPEMRAQFQRDEDNRQRRWVESIVHKPCAEAARLAAARQGDALLLWVDANGEFRAQRIQRETNTFREFVPAYLQRKAAT